MQSIIYYMKIISNLNFELLVKDIKYTAESSNPNNPIWKNWTVMIIYETN